ncbi:AMP-binding protein [Microbacterium gorillae]|uniref:AMP-binding protein n=1 Tax=Microbacterium gorillae TaxID=1231063 RepID=UPI000590192D|nr:AMP-binding protein [Microbacterium gorillae]
MHFTAEDDPRAIHAALRAAYNGSGPVLALGAPIAEDAELPAGTVAVMTTSGSTGVPKSVVLSRSALTCSAMATADRIGSGAWLLALPASYVAGLQVLVRSLVQGHEPSYLSGKFTPMTFLTAAGLMNSSVGGVAVPRYTALVPAQVQTLLDAADDPAVVGAVRSFAGVLVGGQALPMPMRERAADLGWNLIRTYGSTETSGGCVYDGRPLDGTRLEIVDGEVRIAGPTLADGYLGDPNRTAEVFPTDSDGVRWYRTGDGGSIDASGELRIDGRLDNVIISGGVNVSLDRVERVVRSVPGLERAVVVGVPDDRWGQVPVVVLPAGEASAAALLTEARGAVESAVGVAGRPARIVPLADFPYLSSGKPDRRAITAAVS